MKIWMVINKMKVRDYGIWHSGLTMLESLNEMNKPITKTTRAFKRLKISYDIYLKQHPFLRLQLQVEFAFDVIWHG